MMHGCVMSGLFRGTKGQGMWIVWSAGTEDADVFFFVHECTCAGWRQTEWVVR